MMAVFTIEVSRVAKGSGWVAAVELDNDVREGVGPTPDDAVANLADELVFVGVLADAVKAGGL